MKQDSKVFPIRSFAGWQWKSEIKSLKCKRDGHKNSLLRKLQLAKQYYITAFHLHKVGFSEVLLSRTCWVDVCKYSAPNQMAREKNRMARNFTNIYKHCRINFNKITALETSTKGIWDKYLLYVIKRDKKDWVTCEGLLVVIYGNWR